MHGVSSGVSKWTNIQSPTNPPQRVRSFNFGNTKLGGSLWQSFLKEVLGEPRPGDEEALCRKGRRPRQGNSICKAPLWESAWSFRWAEWNSVWLKRVPRYPWHFEGGGGGPQHPFCTPFHLAGVDFTQKGFGAALPPPYPFLQDSLESHSLRERGFLQTPAHVGVLGKGEGRRRKERKRINFLHAAITIESFRTPCPDSTSIPPRLWELSFINRDIWRVFIVWQLCSEM
jgi:hypothetical protein